MDSSRLVQSPDWDSSKVLVILSLRLSFFWRGWISGGSLAPVHRHRQKWFRRFRWHRDLCPWVSEVPKSYFWSSKVTTSSPAHARSFAILDKGYQLGTTLSASGYRYSERGTIRSPVCEVWARMWTDRRPGPSLRENILAASLPLPVSIVLDRMSRPKETEVGWPSGINTQCD